MLSNLVALLSSRIFVGYPLNRNETWVRICPYSLHSFVNGNAPDSFGPHLAILWMALQVCLLEKSWRPLHSVLSQVKKPASDAYLSGIS